MADRDDVHASFRAYCKAMVTRDTAALDSMLVDGSTLTHMTGYVQPKEEWLAEMEQGEFVYYGVVERELNIDVAGDTARLHAKTITDARVYGSRNKWRLQLIMDMARHDGRWVITATSASTW